jgi:hypothetical protein
MNPDRIYRQYRDDALAGQITASKYTTFVAMPFGEQFSYRSREVYSEVVCKAAERANEKGGNVTSTSRRGLTTAVGPLVY